ncbi:MAG: acyltransferase family protein [Blautia sp.]
MKKRNGEIDLFKFLFSIMVVLFHSKNFIVTETDNVFPGGAIAVSFFFIVSGYLLVQSSMKIQTEPDDPVGPLTVGFIWKKVKGLCPDIYVAWIVAFIVESFIVNKYTIAAALRTIPSGIFELTFLISAGLQGSTMLRVNHVTWYLSSMLLVMAFYYPLLLKKKRTFPTLIAPLIAVFIYGYVCTNLKAGFGSPSTSLGFIRKGLLRGFAEIALGCACYFPAQKLKNLKPTIQCKIILSIILAVSFGVVFREASSPITSPLDILLPLSMAIGVIISFSGHTIWYDFLNRPFIHWLGAFSFDLYISHGFWSHAISILFPSMSWRNRLSVYLSFVLATALFVKYFSQWILKHWPAFTKRVHHLMIQDEN